MSSPIEHVSVHGLPAGAASRPRDALPGGDPHVEPASLSGGGTQPHGSKTSPYARRSYLTIVDGVRIERPLLPDPAEAPEPADLHPVAGRDHMPVFRVSYAHPAVPARDPLEEAEAASRFRTSSSAIGPARAAAGPTLPAHRRFHPTARLSPHPAGSPSPPAPRAPDLGPGRHSPATAGAHRRLVPPAQPEASPAPVGPQPNPLNLTPERPRAAPAAPPAPPASLGVGEGGAGPAGPLSPPKVACQSRAWG